MTKALVNKLKNTGSRLFLENFVRAMAVFVGLKLFIVAYTLISAETRGSEPIYVLFTKTLFLFWGADALSAALAAVVIGLLVLPLACAGRRRAQLVASFVGLLLFSEYSALSWLSQIYQGGLLGKLAFDLAFMEQGGEMVDWLPAIVNTAAEFFTLFTWLVLIFTALGAALAFGFAPLILTRPGARWRRGLTALILGEIVVSFVVLPPLMSGEVAALRVYTNGLEQSPVTALVGSYTSPWLAALSSRRYELEDEFEMDYSGIPEVTSPPAAPLAGATKKKTNVIIMALESVGAPYLVGDKNPMPFLVSLANRPDGVSFNAHYSTWALTTKAFFSITCSEYPFPTYKPVSLINPAIPAVSLSEVLKGQGYFTALMTSQDLAYDRQRRLFNHHHLDLIQDRRDIPGADKAWAGTWGIDDRVKVGAALDLIDRQEGKPFYLFMGTVGGHYPFVASPEAEKDPLDDRIAEYMRALGFVDERVRQLITGLTQRGLMDNTLVVIVSDHGDGHDRHAGRNVYEEIVHVPLVMVGPQLQNLDPQVPLVTSHVDIAPTILGLMGIPIPDTMKGRDLTVDGTARMAIFGGRPPKFQLGLVDGKWKYILEKDSIEFLHDLSVDPGEYVNLAEQRPDQAGRYKEFLRRWDYFSRNLIENYARILVEHRAH